MLKGVEMMDLSIIIVNWNTGDLLEKCVKSIKKETKNLLYEIIVYDNNSKDSSITTLEEKYPDVTLIKGTENLGFSKGNNKAVNISKGEYILLLNPDTIILDKAIEKTYRFIKSLNENDLVGCKLLNKDLTTQLSAAYFPSIFRYTLAKISNYNINEYTHQCDWVMGAYMMLKKSTYIDIGGFNENYFMYCEDMDLCYKIYKNLGSVYFYSDAQIVHLYNQSGEKKWKGKREEALKESTFKYLDENCRSSIRRYILKGIYSSKFYLKKILKQ